MTYARTFLTFLLGVVGAMSALAGEPRAQDLEVDVTREGAVWTATFNFPSASGTWAFKRSNVTRRGRDSWRLRSWTVQTPGVRLERRGEYDVLTAINGSVPRRVSIRFEPFGEDLLADYDPALVFTDGTVALFTGHFEAGPWIGDTARPEGAIPETKIDFRDAAGSLLYKGTRYRTVTTNDLETYVVFGTPQLLATENLTGIIDPQVPEWLRQEMIAFLPHSLEIFRERLGAPGGHGRPTIMVSWAGPTPGIYSQGGSVLPNLIVARLEGERLLERSESQLQGLRWFVAHESAHFWLGEAVSYSDPSEAWITEGGANLLAYRLIETIDANYQSGFELHRDWSDCVHFAENKPIATAGSRNEHRAFYACGAVFAMVAEGAAQKSGRDFFDFVRDLVAANRQSNGGDGRLTADEWLAALTAVSGDETIARDIRTMLNEGVPDPRATIASLLQRVGRQPPE